MTAAAKLTEAEKDALRDALHNERTLDAGLNSSRAHRLSTLRRMQAKGLVTEDLGALVDGDGWTLEPERFRRCFFLTPSGRTEAHRIERDDWSKP